MLTTLLISLLACSPQSAPCPCPAIAAHVSRWDAHAHRTIAALAYARLRPATRARVDALLRVHPDIDSLTVSVDRSTPDGIREITMRASVWPDRIRGDARFFEGTMTPTPSLPGFPDMLRRSDWHYIDRAFADDGTAPVPMTTPSTPVRLAASLRVLADDTQPAPLRAYWLSWVLHVVGDLHQPLHGTSRAAHDQPAGDAGGNRTWVRRNAAATDSLRLHGIWDGAFTNGDTVRNALAAAERVGRAHMAQPLGVMRSAIVDSAATLLQQWADESQTLAQYVVYVLPPRDANGPPPLDESYRAVTSRVGESRVAQAADRLVAVLEGALGEK